MSHDRRIGLASLAVGLFGVAAFYLWPNQKWIGWSALGLAVMLCVPWGILEIVHWGKRRNPHIADDWREKLPDRGDYSYSTSEGQDGPDGSFTFTATAVRQIDRRSQMWESLSAGFKELNDKPIPIWCEWIYTNETKQFQWWVRHSSHIEVKLCIELCKEAGRLLLADPQFKTRFPDISAVLDDGDRWLLGIYKVAEIGKVTAHGSSVSYGVETTAEGGEIKDLPGASQVLCQMARNGF